MEIELTEEQAAVADAALTYLKRPHKKDLRIGGLAGTGKSVLVNHIRRKTQCHVCAYTGKAANVLRGKGVGDAKTIHSLIYDDLLSFGVPLLCVGDHGQLEPIGDNPGLMKNPDFRLEKIHRQAAGSPIICFAHEIRQGEDPMEMDSETNEAGRVDVVLDRGVVRLSEVDKAIVAFNKHRVDLNRRFRKAKGLAGEFPLPGDKLICLRNEARIGLFNGMQATMLATPTLSGDLLSGEVELEDERRMIVHMLADQFYAEKTVERAPRFHQGVRVSLWDYGYAVTCHKSQGSSWDTVMVVDVNLPPKWNERRWRYTAATRAANRLIWRVP